MDINELITNAESLAGDNKELSSALGEIKSASEAIVGKKTELVDKVSTLSGGIKELGGAFGIEKDSAKDILGEIVRLKGEYESKISTLSGDKDSVLTKTADLESKITTLSESLSTIQREKEEAEKSIQLNEKKETVKEKLSEAGIKDPSYQRMAIATLKDDHGDLLSIDDIDKVVGEFAKNNLKLVDSDLKSGNGSKIKVSDLTGKKISDMSPEEKKEYLKQKYNLQS